MKTRRGIYKNLQDSDYCVEIGECTYYFSSQVYMNKFIELAKTPSINSMVFVNTFNLIQYIEIEKRGFRVVVEGVEFDCQRSLMARLEKIIVTKLNNLTNE